MYNLKFPREAGNPKRKTCVNREQFMDFINFNIDASNLYTNVYNFSEFRPPWMLPNYESAIIDRIYFDIDQKVKENGEWVTVPAYENMLKIHEWCIEKDIIHFPRHTGSAYDIIIATDPNVFIQNKKECIANAQQWLCKELGNDNIPIKMDPQVIGDIARIHRIDNTFNHKPTARRFCIPLDPEIIYTGEKNIFEIAKKQRFTNNWYGSKYWNISEHDTPEMKYRDILPIEMPIIDESQFAELGENIPDCVKGLLSRVDLNWKERRNVILALRDNCYLLDETIAILRKHLSPKKFGHCIRDEKQPYYLYRNEKYMFPHQEDLLDLGVCPYGLNTFCAKAKNGCLMYQRDEWLNGGNKNGN